MGNIMKIFRKISNLSETITFTVNSGTSNCQLTLRLRRLPETERTSIVTFVLYYDWSRYCREN